MNDLQRFVSEMVQEVAAADSVPEATDQVLNDVALMLETIANVLRDMREAR